ncbi:redoxin domain-containing protein [Natronolimnobius sp. AArcel1]|uniref:redoxin domain-containing protein n=1 Tax=Natronolimnobius sp. AArcel1 TaxID=1679093 RepID=UPI0013E9DF84|nr:redoxin domain-containing protein [Natronolimnobius sp. AArcel1]NGM68891.1 redoxin domain-containing protein [Natronolimnobius sp. AArcel1]
MPEFDVVDLEPASHPEPGEDAPAFTRPLVTDEFWEDRSLSSVVTESERTILVFTPMIGSFLATYIWDELRERGWSGADGTQLVGVSAANPYTVTRFLEDNDLEVRLFADPANDVARAYGVEHDVDGMAGISEPRPAIIALDSDGTVEHAWAAEEWPEFPDYDALESELNLDLE